MVCPVMSVCRDRRMTHRHSDPEMKRTGVNSIFSSEAHFFKPKSEIG
jgi:hypothetical protein